MKNYLSYTLISWNLTRKKLHLTENFCFSTSVFFYSLVCVFAMHAIHYSSRFIWFPFMIFKWKVNKHLLSLIWLSWIFWWLYHDIEPWCDLTIRENNLIISSLFFSPCLPLMPHVPAFIKVRHIFSFALHERSWMLMAPLPETRSMRRHNAACMSGLLFFASV